jgi:hypothetical protein
MLRAMLLSFRVNLVSFRSGSIAGVVELADALDSKSVATPGSDAAVAISLPD